MDQYNISSAGLDNEFSDVLGIPNMTGTPERRLLLAILERAVLDLVGNDEREVQEAEEWLFSDTMEGSGEQFSFAWICEQLDLDRERIAAKIRKVPRRGNRKVAPWYFMKTVSAHAA